MFLNIYWSCNNKFVSYAKVTGNSKEEAIQRILPKMRKKRGAKIDLCGAPHKILWNVVISLIKRDILFFICQIASK